MISVRVFKNIRYVWQFGGFGWGGVADLPLTSSDMSVFHKPVYIMVIDLQEEVIKLLV